MSRENGRYLGLGVREVVKPCTDRQTRGGDATVVDVRERLY